MAREECVEAGSALPYVVTVHGMDGSVLLTADAEGTERVADIMKAVRGVLGEPKACTLLADDLPLQPTATLAESGLHGGEIALQAAVTTLQQKCAGWSAQELRPVGYPATELRAAGYDFHQIWAAGYSAAELRAAGYSLRELKTAACSAVVRKWPNLYL